MENKNNPDQRAGIVSILETHALELQPSDAPRARA
jgi:hypothetical protein